MEIKRHNQSLGLAGIQNTKNDIRMSEPIKPAYVIFYNEKSFLQQDKNDVIASGPIVNIYIFYRLSLKTMSSSSALVQPK